MEKTTIKLALEIGSIGSRSMSLKIFVGNQLVFDKISFESDREYVQFDVSLPTKLEFVTDGKGPNDTIVDSCQSIVSDMYIKISRLSLNNMPVKTWILEKSLFSGKSDLGQHFTGNYLGYNGTTTLDLAQHSAFEFFLDALSES